ncbi:DNA cytosine methyltransferase [Citrobacter freundii]|uniref:DNA cytosine methyltransferase n=1 Tax=Citrobacter freundii TaxID=546 RepID=UPI001BD155ED|nr:DNA cytosine methyltransferase [Citrobacter freundii]
MAAYYNEIDPFAAQWLRNLIAGGHIAPGEVDERSIEDVTPDDLRGFTQCHFFAGIGVWSHSLRIAGWGDDQPVWTGSCPCQPFSAAGKGDGFADDRHLWPHFFHLISERRPQHVFGEQVASGNANVWFDLVQADLEGMGYAFGLVPFASAGIGAPHIRERAYWVAYANNRICDEGETLRTGRNAVLDGCIANRLADTDNEQHSISISRCGHEYVSTGRQQDPAALAGLLGDYRPLEVNGFWRDADWLLCRDGQWRPVESGTFPLVARFAKILGHGKSSLRAMAGRNRTGRLKGYGNAINAQAAAAFISAYMETANVPTNSTGSDIR